MVDPSQVLPLAAADPVPVATPGGMGAAPAVVPAHPGGNYPVLPAGEN